MLRGRSAAVFGFASEKSIAWHVATAMHKQGASVAIGIQSDRFRDRVERLAAEHWGAPPAAVIECDVSKAEDVVRAGQELQAAFPGGLHALVHSIAFASASGIRGSLLDCSAADYAQAHLLSAHSLLSLTRAALPALEAAVDRSQPRTAPCVLAMTYEGARRAVPQYGLMGPAKASLEAAARGLAVELGPRGVRVNCVSPGTMQTLAARGIPGFTDLHAAATAAVPGPVVPTAEDVGATAAWLASEAAAGVHGQIISVDGGLSALAFPGLTTQVDSGRR